MTANDSVLFPSEAPPDGDDLMPHLLRDFAWEEPTWYPPGDAARTIYGPLWDAGWSTRFIDRVICEYKRFLLLVMRDEHPVVPSTFVEFLWQTHRRYPRTYSDFCQSILNKVMADNQDDFEKMERTLQNVARRLFEHDLGTSANPEEYMAQYRATIGFYLEVFGEPPLDIWTANPPVQAR